MRAHKRCLFTMRAIENTREWTSWVACACVHCSRRQQRKCTQASKQAWEHTSILVHSRCKSSEGNLPPMLSRCVYQKQYFLFTYAMSPVLCQPCSHNFFHLSNSTHSGQAELIVLTCFAKAWMDPCLGVLCIYTFTLSRGSRTQLSHPRKTRMH